MSHARRLGVSWARLRRGDVSAHRYGLRAPADLELDAVGELLLYSLRLPTGHFFSHTSAARLHGLWLPSRLEADPTIHVGCPPGHRRREGRDVVGHLVDPRVAQPVLHRGLATLGAVDAWAEMVPLLSTAELVAVGDQLVRRQRPVAELCDLEAALGRRSRRRGCRQLADALSQVRGRTDSVKETELRLLVLSWGCAEPEVNRRIEDARGRFIGYADLSWPDHRVLLEYDPCQHRTDEGQFEKDIDRLDRFAQDGWRVLRASRRHLGGDREQLRYRLDRALRQGGWDPR